MKQFPVFLLFSGVFAVCAFASVRPVSADMSTSTAPAAVSEVSTSTATSTATSTTPRGPTRNDLENLIKQKSEDLDKINSKLTETQLNLLSTQSQKKNLQTELTNLDKNIGQLQLNIQADQITGQKLALEIDSIGYDIRDIEASMNDKRGAIASILQELQKKENQNLLSLFLQNGTLADSVFEAQSLQNIKTQLVLDISNLKNLHQELYDKIQEANDKKSQIETHRKNLSVRKIIVQDQKQEKKVILAQTQSKETVYQQQLDELKKQQDTIEDEIAAVEDQLRANFNVDLLPGRRPGLLMWPVKMIAQGGKGIITQHFGEKSYLYRNKPHNGLDIGTPIGTPVYAAGDGAVTAVGNNDKNSWNKYQYGKYILIKHDNNLATLYAHLSRQIVSNGARVKKGDIIGYSGNTGYATGPHLHFGLYWAPSILMRSVPPAAGLVPMGVVINPEDYL